jgi:small-conductance mechanosensitive channel
MRKIWLALIKPQGQIAKLLLCLFALGFLSLGVLDYLYPIKSFLDSESLAIRMGDTRFSVYILTKSAIVVVIVFWIAGLCSDFGEKHIKNLRGIKASNKALIIKALQIAIYCLVTIIGLNFLGIDLTALAIFSGAAGIGIGFGLQKVTSNFISGLILLFEKIIEKDDLIELSDGTYGFIKHTKARYTLIESFEGKEIIIPNEHFITNKVTNWSHSNTKARLEIIIRVDYNSNLHKAKQLILQAANDHPLCLTNPAAVCFLKEFADSAVQFSLMFWVADITKGKNKVKSDILFAIWDNFNQHSISIPYKQLDIRIKENPKNN